MKLPNGHEGAEPSIFPDDWWLGEEKVLCGCGVRCNAVFPFIKSGHLWIRVRHSGEAGFCEMEAISDDMREQRAQRVLHPALRSR